MLRYLREAWAFRREADSMGDFARLIRVRLGLSKLGRWIAPRPFVAPVNTRSLGPGVALRSHTTGISVFKEIVFACRLSICRVNRTLKLWSISARTQASHTDGFASATRPRGSSASSRIPATLRFCKANAQGDPACEIVAACIGGQEWHVRIASDFGEWANRIVDGDGSIPVVTMPWLLDRYGIDRIDILKCDIQRAEDELFQDCRPWIGRVGAMIVE